MYQIFITGTSSGIGRALSREAISRGHKVHGLSRNRLIEDPLYEHHTLDLSDVEKVSRFAFRINEEAERVILINNAGWLGEVKPVGQLNPDKIKRLFDINTTAPAILCAAFAEKMKAHPGKGIVMNISSGAASYAVPSWSTYCASKAALSMFTKVMQLDHPELHCMALAPGVVDTAMQESIRDTDERDFPDRERFVRYKANNELSSPEDVARKIFRFLDHPEQKPEVAFSLREIAN